MFVTFIIVQVQFWNESAIWFYCSDSIFALMWTPVMLCLVFVGALFFDYRDNERYIVIVAALLVVFYVVYHFILMRKANQMLSLLAITRTSWR